jgi:hypothetical protein
MSRIFLAGLLGGIGMFFWTFAAYTLLPLGNIGISRLPNESAVLGVLQHSIAERSGAYLFPAFRQSSDPSDKKAEGAGDPAEIVARHPSGILIYNAAGTRPFEMFRWLLVDFVIELAEVVIAVFLLGLTRLTTFVARVSFVLLIGVVVGIATNLSYWNWFGFPWNYTLGLVFIQVVGFLCAGLVAALVLRKQTFGVKAPVSFLQKLFWNDFP